jgi:hypothetical protein
LNPEKRLSGNQDFFGTPRNQGERGNEEKRELEEGEIEVGERYKFRISGKKTLVPREEGHQGFKEREDEGGEWGNPRRREERYGETRGKKCQGEGEEEGGEWGNRRIFVDI